MACWRRAWVIEGDVYIERNGTLEVPNNVMNSTDTCPCTTDRHHERPRPVQLPARQRQRHQATLVPPDRAASRGGEPKRGYQSLPQSSSKPPDSAERCEWLSAAMRLAERHRSSMVRWPVVPSTPACCSRPSRYTSSGTYQPASGSSAV